MDDADFKLEVIPSSQHDNNKESEIDKNACVEENGTPELNAKTKGFENEDDNNCITNEGSMANSNEDEMDDKVSEEYTRRKNNITYSVNDRPPWYISIILGFQHFLTMFGATVSIPLLLAPSLCIGSHPLLLSELIGTSFFVAGLVTILQSTLGVRLPIIQGGTFAFLSPTFAILAVQGDCPPPLTVNSTEEEIFNTTIAFKIRMREIQGAVMVGSCVQVVIGFTGIVGFFLQFIGPLTIAPTIALIGMTLFSAAGQNAGLHWGMSGLTIVFILGFSQYMSGVQIPFCGRDDSGTLKMNKKFPLFKLFPIILGICSAWLVSYIFTITGIFPNDPDTYGYYARTDLNSDVLKEAPWFRFPYPGQWGKPTVSTAGALGMIAGIVASMIESLGDYYACARLCGAPPPPPHAINRGVGIEGIGCILAGAWGSGNGTTSYSENIGAIGITKVGSRQVIQVAGLIMMVIGIFNKFSALFTTIPDPVVGGVFCVMFGMVAAVGLSNLQFIDLNSTRNLCVLGFSFFMGLVVPNWMEQNPGIIATGIAEIDQLITVLLSTGMFVGGIIALILDNTMPGTAQERGILKWREEYSDETDDTNSLQSVYDFPIGMGIIRKHKWTRYLPFSPTFTGFTFFSSEKCRCCRKNGHGHNKEHGVEHQSELHE